MKEFKLKYETTLTVALGSRMLSGIIEENLMLAQIERKDDQLLKTLNEADKQFDRLKM